MNNHTGTKSKLKKRIICKKCFRVFINNEHKISIQCPSCGKFIDARDRSGTYKKYCKKYPEKAKQRLERMKKYDQEYKRERGLQSRIRVKNVVFNLISNNNPICANCGCDDKRFLEINHIQGGGNKELKNGKNANVFMWNIYKGRRKTGDLNLLCRVCNAFHYLELKFGKFPMKILWKS